MKKSLMVSLTGLMLFIFFTSAHANLINNGDFQNGSQVILGNFSSSLGPYGVWLGTHGGSAAPTDWWIVDNQDGGKAVGDYYAKHFQNTSKLYQGVEINSTILPIGSQLSISFDYIYDSGFTGDFQSSVWLLGIMDSDPNLTPYFPIGGSNPFPIGDVLYSDTLAPPFVGNWTNFSASNISVGKNYDSVALVFFAGAFGQTGVPGLRGIDNVNVNVPEPTTMLLLGFGLIGLAGVRRKIQK